MSINVSRFRRPAPVLRLGDRTRAVRRDMNLTQEEFVLGLSAYLPTIKGKAYAAWESGKNEPKNITDVCEALEAFTGISKEWFLGWSDPRPTDPGVNSGQDLRFGHSRAQVIPFPQLAVAA